MVNFENRFGSFEKIIKPTVEQVLDIMSRDKNLEGLDISDLKLNGENLSGGKFRGCDARCIDLSPRIKNVEGKEIKEATDIRETDWTGATFASAGDFTSFKGVNAEGAVFGYGMTLDEREGWIAQIQEEDKRGPNEFECGGYFNFEGSEGIFTNTKWSNIDFGGNSGYEAFFPGANFEGAIFDGCNLGGIDLSGANLEKVSIRVDDIFYLQNMKINKNNVEAVAQGIVLSDPADQKEFNSLLSEFGSRRALEIYFSLEIIG